MSDKKIIISGYSGHAFVVADTAISDGLNLHFYSEIKEIDYNPFKLKYIGFEGDTNFKAWDMDIAFILGIGNNTIRQRIANNIIKHNQSILNVIHPSVSKSDLFKIGIGNFIARNVSINPLVEIGNHCILNTACIIEHECILADAVHIAPGAVLAGNVQVGERSFIGANTVIKQGVKIGKDVVIGAGSVVLQNISDGKKVVGNPSREL